MKRDWTILRGVLEDVEQERLEDSIRAVGEADRLADACGEPSEKKEDAYFEHLVLAIEAGLVAGVEVATSPAPPPWHYGTIYPRLTMSGHDVLDSLRSKTVWGAVKAAAAKHAVPVTLDLIKAVASAIAKGAA